MMFRPQRALRATWHSYVALFVVLTAAGCLAVPGAKRKQCSDSSDCETVLGEVCEENACYGGPPAGAFGIIVSPPADRSDLGAVEREISALPGDGQVGILSLEPSVRITGRVEAFCVAPLICQGASIAATIAITRPPMFRGGPGFKTVVTSREGMPKGEASFTALVPRAHNGDPNYVVTIVPESSGNGDRPLASGATSAAEQAPPLRMMLDASANGDLGRIVLGSERSVVLSGTLSDAASQALGNYRVVALGRLDSGGPLTEVSTVDYSTTGVFSVIVADGALEPLAIEARPYDATLPKLYLYGLAARSASYAIAQPPGLGSPVAVSFGVEGLSGDGQVKSVGGAHVSVSGVYAQPVGNEMRAVVAVDATSSSDGAVQLSLLNGAAFANSYKMRVIPPAGSELGVIYDEVLSLSRGTPVRLPRRVAMRGRVVDGTGQPVSKISVTARPSLRFMWSLDEAARNFVAEIPPASAVTGNAGDFVLWVDSYIAATWARYDLEFEAPSGSDAANWVRSDVEVPRTQQTAVAMGDVVMPDSALLRGTLTDSGEQPVVGGDLAIYQIPVDSSLCQLVLFPPSNCEIPARRLGKGTSDPRGIAKLALPR